MIRLSIVIPFYNVEQFIGECLDSVYDQDIPESEYEVICVNDASPDNSRQIVLEYMSKHTNLVLVEHEVNKKLGAARNTGRGVAKGRYLWNVDSDDKIAPNCLGEILTTCETNDLDVYLFGYYEQYGKLIKVHGNNPWDDNCGPTTGPFFWKHQVVSHQGEISQVWTQVYRRSFLDEKNIYSPEINMGEDEAYSYSSILFADRLLARNTPYYINRKNPLSLTGVFDKKPRIDNLIEACFICTKQHHYVYSQIAPEEKEIRASIKNTIRYDFLQYRFFETKMTPSERALFRKTCRKQLFDFLFIWKYISMKQKVGYFLFLIGA